MSLVVAEELLFDGNLGLRVLLPRRRTTSCNSTVIVQERTTLFIRCQEGIVRDTVSPRMWSSRV